MSAFKDTLLRLNPGGGDRIGVGKFFDPYSADIMHQEVLEIVGSPVQLLQLMNVPTATLQDWPADGATTPGVLAATAGGNDQVQLEGTALGSGASPLSPLGFGITMIDGPQAGQFREFVDGGQNGWATQSSRLAKVNRAWSGTAPQSGNKYVIGIPCFRGSEAVVKTEFQNNAASADNCGLQVILYDYGARSGDVNTQLTTARRALRFVDMVRIVTNTDDALDTMNSGYRHGSAVFASCRGAGLFKVKLVTAPAVGSVVLYAGAT